MMILNAPEYIKSLSKKDILEKDELNNLILIAQDHKKYEIEISLAARNLIIEKNQRFASYIAKKYYLKSKGIMELGDFLAEANFGLVNAIKKFDVNKGYCFSTYAKAWIYNALQLAENRCQNSIYVPLKADVDRNDYASLSLDSNCYGEKDCSLGDFVEDDKTPSAFDSMVKNEIEKNMHEILSVLGKKERYVVESYYEIGVEPKSLTELAREFNITKEGVRQIRNRAEKKLRSEAEKNSMQYYLAA